MIAPPFRSPERDAAVEALIAAARAPAASGSPWSIAALRRAAGPDADLLFPGGPPELVETWVDLVDRRMVERARAPGGAGAETRVGARVRTIILDRLAEAAPERDVVRRGFALLAVPGEASRAARVTARTADAIWQAAGDDAAGVAFVTKRATVASVYGATLLFWLRRADEPEAVAAFLDRRLAAVARFGRWRRRLAGAPARPAPGAGDRSRNAAQGGSPAKPRSTG